MTGRVLSLDFETFSHRDIREVGAFQYVRCDHFVVTVIAWAFDDEPVQSAVWPDAAGLPKDIYDHIRSGGIIHAWNATFEHTILTNYYGVDVPFEQMSCTMQRALVDGLPGKLENAGPALGLAIVKDKTAHGLMLRMGKPKRDGSAWHETDAVKLAALEAYCRRDVEAEREVGRHVPKLSAFEKRVSELDARSNRAGVCLDGTAIGLLLKAREHIRREQAAEVRNLTGGCVKRIESETYALIQWLRSSTGMNFNSVDKASVASALTRPTIQPHVRRVLEIRAEAAKSSLGKIDRMLAVRAGDGRARGLLQYYGAGRTGRWAGRLIQVQNLPRNVKGVDPDEVLGVLARDAEALGLFYERPLDALSACLRGCITAAQGRLLAMIDLSQIEARVLAWLAGQQDILEVFARGEDVYVHEAAKQGSGDRQFGKVLVLACGYGMGWTKFQTTAEGYGLTLTENEASRAVAQWRTSNREVVKFWYAMEEAARACIGRPGAPAVVRGIRLVVRWGKLHVRKPGGGVLVYHKPRLVDGDLVFDGVSQTTKQWGEQKTYGGKLVENLTQAVARDLVAEAMVRVWEHYKLIPVMTVHDELVFEVDPARVGLADDLKDMVDQAPAWGGGLPLASKLAVGSRYGK